MSRLAPRLPRVTCVATALVAVASVMAGCDSAVEDPATADATVTPAPGATTAPATSPASRPRPAKGMRFTEHAPPTGIDIIVRCGDLPTEEILEVNGGGLALFDYDDDGDLDLLVAVGATLDDPSGGPGSRLFRNDGDLEFVDVTEEAGIDVRGWATGVAAGDIDADGDEDLFIARFGPDVLLRNEGDGTFTDITAAAGVGDPGWATSAAFGDLDGDGDLDLFVVRYLEFDVTARPARAMFQGVEVMGGPRGLEPQVDRVYENVGDGRFEDRTAAWGVDRADAGFGLNLVITDIDGDGRQDVSVGNDSNPNHLWVRRDGGAGLVDTAVSRGLATNRDGAAQATMGIAVADVNADGLPDFFSTNFSSDTNTLHLSAAPEWHDDATRRYGLGASSRPFLGWGCWFADFDHDGDEDLIAVNGHVYPQATPALMDSTWRQPPLLYDRRGDRFERVDAAVAGDWLDAAHLDRATVAGDLDRDGDVDLVIAELNGPVRILENRVRTPQSAPGDEWLTVTLRDRRAGTGDPRGRGARIVVERGGTTRTRWIVTGAGFQSSPPPEVHFGLPETGPVTVHVHWPDGHLQTVELEAAGRHLEVTRANADPSRPETTG